jgi:peptidoglycan/LPS O-acetylase OafA/YrhL
MERGLPHNQFIDELRGVAILVVVLLHYVLCFPISYSQLAFISNGYYGVALFFAISGFLITGNMLRRYDAVAQVKLREFYVSRAARILPPLVLALSILTFLSKQSGLSAFTFPADLSVAGAVWYALTLRFNQYSQAVLPWAVLWSLSIEEMFYLTYPIAARLLHKEWLLVTVMIMIVIHGALGRSSGSESLYSYFGCFDLMDIGALAAIVARRLGPRTPVALLPFLKIVGAAVALLTYLLLDVRAHCAIGPSLIALGGAMMLFSSQVSACEKPLRSQRTILGTLLGSIGALSYEIYLFHPTILLLLAKVLPALPNAGAYLVFVFCLAVIYLICSVAAQQFSKPIRQIVMRMVARPRRRTESSKKATLYFPTRRADLADSATIGD